jgi:glutamate/tyrosine decarboxylase-like PLP-dependent enzyme
VDEVADLLGDVARRAAEYLASLPQRSVAPAPSAIEGLDALDEPLPAEGSTPGDVVALLDRVGSPATVASAGPRYFGFVIGGAFPVAVASNWLATAWDQCAGATAMSPVASRIEAIAARWICELLRLPQDTGVGFVTGSTAAHTAALAAARRAVCLKHGWDVDARGVHGAPPIEIVVTGHVHVSVRKALGLLGLGRDNVTAVPVDAQGRIDVGRLPDCGPSTIIVVQSGNVNSGSFDDLIGVADVAEKSGAWMHVDGAFGVWARTSARYGSLVEGLERADSIAASAHKMFNVPYDSAIVTCRDAGVMEGALAVTSSYAVASHGREPNHFTPEGSRRARGIDIWAVLKSLGSSGFAAHVESCCANARRFAEVLRDGGVSVLNDVVYNQVLLDLGPGPRRDKLLAAIQRDGTCWIGPTVWHGRAACRASFCGWATTEHDAERSARAILAAREHPTVA